MRTELTKLTEDNEDNIDFDEVSTEDIEYKIRLLAEELGVDPFSIVDQGGNRYIVDPDGEGAYSDREYWVLTDEEADIEYKNSCENRLLDCYPSDLGIDFDDFLDDNYCIDYMREMYQNDAYGMSSEELVEDLLSWDKISLSDENIFRLRDDVDAEDEDFDEDDQSNYDIIEDEDTLRELWLDEKCSDEDELISEYKEYFGGRELSRDLDDYLGNHNHYPSYINYDELLDWYMEHYTSRGSELAWYDCDELYLGFEEGEDVYAYRIE